MKKTNLQLALALVAAVTPFTLAQDASSSPSTAPNSQTTTSSGQAGAGHDVTPDAAATYPTKQETAPQNPSSAAGETNMAGQGSVTSPSAAPPAAAVGVGAIASSITIGVGVNDAATLQNQIQNALQNEPTLKNDTINASVNDSTIELSGNVQTGKEKETAYRIASSFAENRRVRDRITVSGRGAASSSPNDTPGSTPTGNRNGSPSNPNNPQNPSANNPAANGDASANPR
jgi:osmotically-inducible protein OsmY